MGDVSTIPAGWYPDPQDANRSRWWDGTRWTASVSDPQPPAPAATAFVEPQQYTQQQYTPAAPATAGSGLALTRRQLREQSDQLALAASTSSSSAPANDSVVIARSAHAAEPMPQVVAPVDAPVVEAAPAPSAPTVVDTSAADAAAAALFAAAIASPEPVTAPAAAVPFDWSPNAVMPTRAEAPAPVAEVAPPVVETAPVIPEPVAVVAAPAVATPMAPTAPVTAAAPAEQLSNYAALAALFGSVEQQNPEPTWDDEKAKAPAVAQFDYAASFAKDSESPYAAFGAAPAMSVAPAAPARSTLSVNTGAIWIFVIMPVLQIGLAWLAFDYLGLAAGGFTLLGFLAVQVLLYVILAGIDGKSLKSLGHPKVPSMLWAIVPLLYLIMRVVRTGRRSVGALLIWLLSQAAIVALSLLLAMPLILALMGSSPVAVDAPVVPAAPTMTQSEFDGLLTPEGATAHAATVLARQNIAADDLSCAAFPALEPSSLSLCTLTLGGTPTEIEVPLGAVTVAP